MGSAEIINFPKKGVYNYMNYLGYIIYRERLRRNWSQSVDLCYIPGLQFLKGLWMRI